ncbi:hypothetical protein CMI37_19200 [Candidatus Pacearchaeota archaeon]|nr:hypothetical protein [Candidatus Pacearchaeota archaeon]|tara:strand:- start:292 stop:606 length:315 start_codon:yes stop_codon:yes gene_type:complete
MNYTWDFPQFEIRKESEGQQDVIYIVHWRYTGSEDGYLYSVIGTVSLPYSAGDPFIPFASVTKADVEGWVEDCVDLDEMKACAIAEIAEKKNPTTETVPPPWEL